LNSILLLGLFVASLLLFNPDFVSHDSYANTGAMGGGSSPKHDDDKKGNDGSPKKSGGGSSSSKHDDDKKSGGGSSSSKHDDDKKGNDGSPKKSGGGSSSKHKKGDNDNNSGFSLPATTDNTSTQQTCLDGLAPITTSGICASSQTPTDNIPWSQRPSSPTADLVTTGRSKLKPQFAPPAGVNCVASDECLEPPSTSTTSTPPSTSTTSTPPSTSTTSTPPSTSTGYGGYYYPPYTKDTSGDEELDHQIIDSLQSQLEEAHKGVFEAAGIGAGAAIGAMGAAGSVTLAVGAGAAGAAGTGTLATVGAILGGAVVGAAIGGVIGYGIYKTYKYLTE
jgi:hypothetical protein